MARFQPKDRVIHSVVKTENKILFLNFISLYQHWFDLIDSSFFSSLVYSSLLPLLMGMVARPTRLCLSAKRRIQVRVGSCPTSSRPVTLAGLASFRALNSSCSSSPSMCQSRPCPILALHLTWSTTFISSWRVNLVECLPDPLNSPPLSTRPWGVAVLMKVFVIVIVCYVIFVFWKGQG